MTVRTSNIFLSILIPILMGLAYLTETVVPEVTVTEIESAPLHSLFSGRIAAHITDPHVVKYGWRERMTMRALKRIEPDIIFITGDYVETHSDFGELETYLTRLKEIAPAIASLGNNDYCCRGRVADVFRRVGVPLLENEAGILTDGVDSVYIVGLKDNFLWQDDYFLATRAVPTGAPRIVLGHAPSIAEKLDPSGIELILSGHLHGGQIIVPLYGPLARNTVCFAENIYTAGLYRVNGINLYSNRGLGTSIVPIRFLSRPEIALFEFTE